MANKTHDDWKAEVERQIIASTRAMLGDDVQFDWPGGRQPEPKTVITKSRSVGFSELIQPKRKPIGIGGKCLNCHKAWNVTGASLWKALQCTDCNGFIVTPSGRVHRRVYLEGEEDQLRKLPKLGGGLVDNNNSITY